MKPELTKGNEAIVKAAILAGCRAYYGYPITPASEIAEAAALYFPRVGGVFITVDPDRDTPAVMKDYMSNFDPHLRGLTGNPEAVAAALKAYRVYAKKIPLEGGDYTMDHTALVYLMDKDGRFVAPFSLKQTPEAAAKQLRGYL